MPLQYLCTIHLTYMWKFGEALFFCFYFFYFKFRTVATVPGGIVATILQYFFFFFGLPFVLFFFNIYCYTETTNFIIFLQLLRCQFLISQNKIIKYEIVTNHN